MAKTKKKIIATVTTVLLIVSLCMLVFVIVSRLSGKQPSIFGYSFHIVVTGSMSPQIEVNDFVVCKKVDEKEVKIGDYILFKSADPMHDEKIIIHEVIDFKTIDGNIIFTTKGTNVNASVDKYSVDEVLGVYQSKSKVLGFIIVKLSDFKNWIFIFVLAGLIYAIVKIVKNIARTIKEDKQSKLDKPDKKD